MIKRICGKLFFTVLFYCFIGNAVSQNSLTTHLLSAVPQSNYTNPSFIPCYGFHMSMPMMIPKSLFDEAEVKYSPRIFSPTLFVNLVHTGFKYNDIIQLHPDDSLYINIDNALDKLAKKNYIALDFQIEHFSFGVKIKKKYYINFSIVEKMSFRFCYPKDFMVLVAKGNTEFLGKTIDLSGFGINATHYKEFALDIAKKVDEKLTVGIRPKLLFGLGNVTTVNNNFGLYTDPTYYYLTLNSGLKINTSLPMTIDVSEGQIKGIPKSDSTKNYGLTYFVNNKNKGYALDIGGNYKLTPKITVAASIIDLGFITWKFNPQSLIIQQSQFTFEGIDINSLFKGDSAQKASQMKKLTDSLQKCIDVVKTTEKYTTYLGTKIYLTGIYQLDKMNKVGLMYRGEFFNKSYHSSVTLSMNNRLCRFLSASLSYSIVNRSYANIGGGICLNIWSWQIFAVTDNFYGMLFPETTKTANIFFGMNFVFGCRKYKPNYPQIQQEY
ncbi:MAG: DUF5723 family protein [Bacteroidales bacterium]|nr:DUF5723 family protein [Bacteroidales bacterium]